MKLCNNVLITNKLLTKNQINNQYRYITNIIPKQTNQTNQTKDASDKIPVSIKAYYISRSLNLDKIVQRVYGGSGSGNGSNSAISISNNQHISYQNKSVTVTVS